MSALDRLRTIAEQATPGPWERGDVWLWAGVINTDGSCSACTRHGDPVWVGTSDINGELMLAHKHRVKDPWEPEHRISSPDGLVTGNYDYEEGGIIDAVDTEFIVTFDPPTVLALLDVAEAAEAAAEYVPEDVSDHGRLTDALDRLREVTS